MNYTLENKVLLRSDRLARARQLAEIRAGAPMHTQAERDLAKDLLERLYHAELAELRAEAQ